MASLDDFGFDHRRLAFAKNHRPSTLKSGNARPLAAAEDVFVADDSDFRDTANEEAEDDQSICTIRITGLPSALRVRWAQSDSGDLQIGRLVMGH